MTGIIGTVFGLFLLFWLISIVAGFVNRHDRRR